MGNKTSQRALRLALFFLCNGSATREETIAQVAGYQDENSESAQRRRFERDMKDIEEAGFLVFKSRKTKRPRV